MASADKGEVEDGGALVAIVPAEDRARQNAGRPPEIEDPTNRLIVHPLSRAVVDALLKTRITPNQVSVSSLAFAAAAALAYASWAAPWGPVAALLLQLGWHVLDGADGQLARRLGCASTVGEFVDGLCDHLSQAMLYLAFAWILQRQIGPMAWALATAAAMSHFLQSSFYESGRKSYRRWVYGAGWMRQNLTVLKEAGGAGPAMLGRAYVAIARALCGDESHVDTAMERRVDCDGGDAGAARDRYRAALAGLVRASAVLGANARTIAAFAAMMAGSPLWYFAFEILALNLAMAAFAVWRRRAGRRLAAALTAEAAL